MEVINNPSLLVQYVNKYGINKLFQKDMVEYMKLIKFEPGEIILSKEENILYFYFLVQGKIKVNSLLKNGRTVLLRFIQPFSTVGEIELMGEYPAKNSVEVVEESILIGIAMDTMRKFALEDIKFLKCINKILSNKVFTIDNTMALNLSYPLETRLANYLITITSANTNRVKEIETDNLKDVADLLGSSLRHLNRVIKNMRETGIIKKQNKKILIQDYEKLEQLSVELYD